MTYPYRNLALTIHDRCISVVMAERARLDIALANNPADIEARAALASVEKIKQGIEDLMGPPD